MTDRESDTTLRPGEVAIVLPARADAGVHFIGTIRTPWRTREECPKRGSSDGPVCSIVVDERWREALTDIGQHRRIQVLYWMHQARRDSAPDAPRARLRSALRSGRTRSPRRWSICWGSREPRCACEDWIAWTGHR